MNFIQDYITSASIVLQPYKSLVGQTAAVLSIAQMLSPLFMFNDMRKAKSTLGMPFLPFLLMALLTTLNLRFAQILDDGAMFSANAVGAAVSVVYISIYYHFVEPQDKTSHLTKLVGTIALILAFIAYSKVEDPAKIETRFGVILTSIMYCFFALPVMGIYETLTKKCTRHLPFPMIITGTLVGFCWLLHGVIINSGFIIAQNFVMLGINLFQLSLFLIYPSVPASESKKAKSGKKKIN